MSSAENKVPGSILWRVILLVAGAALAARVALALVFPYLIADDSVSYIELARMISERDFTGFNGGRTPGYPLLILIAGFGTGKIVLLQHLLGIICAVVVSILFYRLTARRGMSLVAGLAAALNPGMIVIERAVLTESLSALLVVLSVAGLLAAVSGGPRWRMMAVAAGTAAAAGALVRPALFYLPPLLGLLAVWPCLTSWRAIGSRLWFSSALALPGILLLVLWSGFNLEHTGRFAPSTIGGISLLDHTGAFMESAPPQYGQIRDIYLKHRASRIESTGHQWSTFYEARQELQDATGLDFAALDGRMKELSLELIKRNPLKYALSVGHAVARFWRPAWYTVQGGSAVLVHGSIPMKLLVGGFVAVHLLLTGCFLLLPLAWWLWSGLRSRLRPHAGWLAVYAVVLGGALTQGMFGLGHSPRYGIPFEPLILPAGAVALFSFYSAIRGKPVREG